jgi:plasmid maintenance system killer protein
MVLLKRFLYLFHHWQSRANRFLTRFIDLMARRELPPEMQNIARRKLRMINNSFDLKDLRIQPSNGLEKLSGNLQDYYSIRINDQ